MLSFVHTKNCVKNIFDVHQRQSNVLFGLDYNWHLTCETISRFLENYYFAVLIGEHK